MNRVEMGLFFVAVPGRRQPARAQGIGEAVRHPGVLFVGGMIALVVVPGWRAGWSARPCR